jgi:hypothetical protein
VSERRTAEIKIRLTPREKGRWQTMADEESTTLSELIRREMNARARMRRQAEKEANPPVYAGSAIGGLGPTALEMNEALHAGRPQRVVLEAPGHDSYGQCANGQCPHGRSAWQFCRECA